MKRYYCVTDIDGIDNYYSNKKYAMAVYRGFCKEADELNFDKNDIKIISFSLPKVRKNELVVRLLNGHSFAENVKKLE
jgi:hypothetical protein